MKWVFLGLALALLLAHPVDVSAQPMQVVSTCGGVTFIVGDGVNGTVDTTGKQCVNATVSVSASIAGFTPSNHYATLTATASSSASTAIPTNTGSVVLYNTGTSAVSCTFASGAAVGVANNEIIQPASSVGYSTTGYDHVACIDQTGSASNLVILSGGAGLFAGAGGGGGSSSGGAVTIADGASVTLGAKADAKSTATDTTPITVMSVLKQISASVQAMVTSLAGSLTVNLPTGASTSTNQTSQITQETATAQALGTTADSVCGTATGTCTLAALIKFLNNAATSAIPTTQSGVATALITCDNSITYDASTNGSTQLVALASGQKIYVCGYSILAAGTVNVELDYGTGTACATGNAKMTPAYQLTAQVGIVDGAPSYRGLATIASNELCLKTNAGVAVQAIVYYTRF